MGMNKELPNGDYIIPLDAYKKSMYPHTDYAALSLALRTKGTELAVAAAYALRTWDGHHRLAQAIAEWFDLLGKERTFLTRANKRPRLEGRGL